MEGESAEKIAEVAEKAKREWFKKVEKLLWSHGHSAKLKQDIVNQATAEYNRVFGRLGVHPLLTIKGGKRMPRYILDRDETWVMYKPPLWQMGSSEFNWGKNVRDIIQKVTSLQGAQDFLMKSEKLECLQEFHGLTQGLKYVDKDGNDQLEQKHRPPFTSWGFIQRLDAETDGPVIICKSWRSQRILQMQMRDHLITKAYICLVHGRLEDRVQHVKCRFAEVGSDANSQIMLKHDAENDPFFEWSQSGTWSGRSCRMAETYFKPMAYYHRKEDNSDYTLVYVNILTGITHQVRITLQSVGHPLVADDRYLPREQANADLKWCPRNFLCEVRQDWFDLCGPHKDANRRQYTRISIENPLPALFQHVLEKKLSLVEKLDPSADLMQGPQYWAIGDQELMARYPKMEEYRRKVMRWGQRKGIHLDAMDRLLLLPKEDIDQILNAYTAPDDPKDESWVCPECMSFNRWAKEGMCAGYGGKDCPGKKLNEANEVDLPKGWKDWSADPTIHFLMTVNPRWLEARRKVLGLNLPSWQRIPDEVSGTACNEDVLLVLEAALVLNAKGGGFGIKEYDLPAVPGLENITLPLAEPAEDSAIQRMRLPGSATGSQWVYTLKGKEKIKHTQDYNCKSKRLKNPVDVDTDKLPEKMLLTKEEKVRQKFEKERQDKADAEAEAKAKAEKKKDDDSDESEEEAGKSGNGVEKKRKWKRLESTNNPGHYYYFDAESGESRTDRPPDFEESAPAWERLPSKSARGEFYYYNRETGESRIERPAGVEILNDSRSNTRNATNGARAREEPTDDRGPVWKREESKSKPGHYYYFNSKTGQNSMKPPLVDPPWKLCESESRKGQFYYFNSETSETVVDPPDSARPPRESTKRPADNGDLPDAKRLPGKEELLPPDWVKKESDTHKNKFYYMNTKTGKTSWTRPVGEAAMWKRKESSSNPGKFYYVHVQTGETKWD